jgi:hypothetical protein
MATALAPLPPSLDELVLPAGDALSFVDSVTGQPVIDGLRCTLVLRRGLRVLGQAVRTAGGVHHWPELPERWREPAPAAPAFADVVVVDEQERFLPLTLPWPLPAAPVGQVIGGSVFNGVRLLRVSLLSAPAGWARVSLTDVDGRVHEGSCDAEGRLSLHLPAPRPLRAAPAPVAPELHVYFDPALAAAARRFGVQVIPDALAWAAQPEVRALARQGDPDPLPPPPLLAAEPAVLGTQGLVPRRSELHLVPVPV